MQAERDQLEDTAVSSASKLETTSKELDHIRADLKSKLEEQQSQFRALEEEQYGDWEKRVGNRCSAHFIVFTVDACCTTVAYMSEVAMVLSIESCGLLYALWCYTNHNMTTCCLDCCCISDIVFTFMSNCQRHENRQGSLPKMMHGIAQHSIAWHRAA